MAAVTRRPRTSQPRRRGWWARLLAAAQRATLRARRAQLLLAIDDLAGATSPAAVSLRHDLVLQLVAVDILTRPTGGAP